MSTIVSPSPVPLLDAKFVRALRAWHTVRGVARAAQVASWPFIDLVVRLWLAQLFLVSGLLKLTHWDTALYLAEHEYPLRWIAPHTAALLGVCIEVAAPPLLALGLATRYAALPLWGLVAVTQYAYQAHDPQLFWLALLAWYAVHGAGPLSCDSLFRRGVAASALPGLPRLIALSGRMRGGGTPWVLAALRVWLAAALLPWPATFPTWLPQATFASVPPSLTLPVAAFLAWGIAVRPAALVLAFASAVTAMTGTTMDHGYHLLVLALLACHGGGAAAVDGWLTAALARREAAARRARSAARLPHVVIVGGGFGGLACALGLRDAPVRVTLIDRTNHHLFQPLLYQVATAALSPGDIAVPLRHVLRDVANARVVLGTVTGVDSAAREVVLGAQRVPYDWLVLATGASHGYFGRDEWAAFAPGLKRIDDATALRGRVLRAFERAETTDDADEQAALMSFVIVGGGPTGVELAGALAELARHGMAQEFRRIDPRRARIVLVQSAPRLLPQFEVALSEHAERTLRELGVEVLTGSRVEQIDETGVCANGERIRARTVLWAAGVTASPAARWLDRAGDSAGRLEVGPDLSVPGLATVFAIGDTAASTAWNGQPVPGLAPAAKQGGAYVATVISAAVRGHAPPAPFRYRHRGSLATIGRQAAVAEFGRVRLWGAPAWWLWGAVHVSFLVGLRNRVSTLLNWFWTYLTFAGGIRLITGADDDTAARSP